MPPTETPFADYSVINSTDIYYTKQPIINQHCLLLVIVLLLLGVGLVIEFTRHGRVLALVLVNRRQHHRHRVGAAGSAPAAAAAQHRYVLAAEKLVHHRVASRATDSKAIEQ